jgi:hypothetical protein
VIGERLGEMTTSAYTLLDAPVPRRWSRAIGRGGTERVYRRRYRQLEL